MLALTPLSLPSWFRWSKLLAAIAWKSISNCWNCLLHRWKNTVNLNVLGEFFSLYHLQFAQGSSTYRCCHLQGKSAPWKGERYKAPNLAETFAVQILRGLMSVCGEVVLDNAPPELTNPNLSALWKFYYALWERAMAESGEFACWFIPLEIIPEDSFGSNIFKASKAVLPKAVVDYVLCLEASRPVLITQSTCLFGE